ncbi:MAG TPA: SLC13 family permease [Chitinophagaceae bacterium]|nr:SLC13 family permease [Chitinophagaceae bacterium]
MKKKINFLALFLAVTTFVAIMYFPTFENHDAQKTLALLIMVAILWVSEAIPLALTGLLIPMAAILLQLVPPKEGFMEFSSPIIFLFMGGFVLAGALSKHALDKMLALKLIKLARGNFYRSAVLLMLATSLVACWVSNTSTVVMMIPLALGILTLLKKEIVTNEAKFLMLGIAYAANIGGILTIISSPPNAIGAEILEISFLDWIKYSLPIFLISFPIMVIVLTLYFKPSKKMRIGRMSFERKQDAPIKTLIAIFTLIIGLWMLDGVIAPLLNIGSGFNAVVAVLGIFLIYITGILSWKEILKSINFDVLFLFGGGLTLGMLLVESGLGELLVGSVSGLIETVPLFLFLWILVAFSIVLTEFMSNTASAAMMLPLLYAFAIQLNINPVILVLPATFAASYGFMLPAGTPPNALVFSTGLVPQKDMLKAGLMLNLIFSLVLTTFFYFIS